MSEGISKRCRKIMEALLENPKGLRGEDIAKRLGVTSRTVRSDIRKLQELLSGCRSTIEAIPNRGYRLDNQDGYDVLMGLMTGSLPRANLDSKVERRRFLMTRFLEALLSDRILTQMDLADEMYVGLTSLKAYLGDFREVLAEHSLEIVQYRNEGICLGGEEIDLRRAIVDWQRELDDEKIDALIFSELSRQEINRLVSRVMESCNLQLTDIALERLCLMLALALHRSAGGHLASCPSSVAQKMSDTFEYSIARELANAILREKGIDVAYNEVFYITQCLMTSKKLVPTEEISDEGSLTQLVDEILRVVKTNFGLDFMEDHYLREGLALHLRIAIAQVNFRVGIRNVLLDSIKKDYPLAFRLGVLAAKVVWEKEQVHFNESEIGYLALHFGAAMSRNNIEEKDVVKNILIVCSAGLGVSILLKAKVKEHFHHRIHVIRVLPAYELTKELLEEADYVLSTVPLSGVASAHKVIRVNHMLRQEDIDRIEQVIFHRPTLTVATVKGFFDEKLFFLDKDFSTREECLEFLTEEAIASGFMSREAKASVFEREKLSPTSIGDLAAIPHSLDANATVSKIAVMVLRRPIPWGDLPVQIVFLLNIEHGKSKIWESLFLRLYDFIKKYHGLSIIQRERSYPRFLEAFMTQGQKLPD